MNEIVNSLLLAGDEFMPAMNLRQLGFTYMLCIEEYCLLEEHVYQKPPLLRLLFLTAGNIISQSYYTEYVYYEFINVIIRVIISH